MTKPRYAAPGPGPKSAPARPRGKPDRLLGLAFSILLLVVAGGVRAAPPDTRLLSGPPPETLSRSAVVTFASSRADSFQCSLDGAPFRACRSPYTRHGLAPGKHSLRVRGRNADGADPTPAVVRWTVAATLPDNPDNARSPLATNVGQLGGSDAVWLVNHFPRAGQWLTQCDGDDCWDTGEQSQLVLDEHGWVVSFGDNPNRRFTHVAVALFNGGSEYVPGGRWVVLYDGEGSLEYGFAPFVEVVSRSAGRDVLNITPQVGSLLRIRLSDINPANPLRNIRVIAPGGICGQDRYTYAPRPAACPDGDYRPFERIYTQQRFHPLLLQAFKPYRALRFMQFSGVLYDYLNAPDLAQPQERRRWADRSRLEDALWAGGWQDGPPPHELMFELSNQLAADPWVNLHFWVDDDYTRELARLALNHLAPHLNVYLEWSNEVWNTAPPYGFYGARIEQWAQARWPDATYPDGSPVSGYTKRMNYVGMRSDQVCAIWKQVWGTEAHRVRCVMPAGPFDYPAGEALACPLYAAEGRVADCAGRMWGVAAGPYFGGYINDNPNAQGGHFEQLEAWTRQPDGGLGTLFDELRNGGHLPADEGIDGPLAGALPRAVQVMRVNKRIAEQWGLRLLAYEAGQHLTPLSGLGTSCNEWSADQAACEPYFRIQNLFVGANRDPRMGELYDQYLVAWRDAGGELFGHFTGIYAASPQYGSWGAKEYAGQPARDAPKYQALLRFKRANPCWWAGCARPAP